MTVAVGGMEQNMGLKGHSHATLALAANCPPLKDFVAAHKHRSAVQGNIVGTNI